MKNVLLPALMLLVSTAAICQEANPPLPPPDPRKTMNFSNVIGWNGDQPAASRDFEVTLYAGGFENPRWMYVTESGDVLVAESNGHHPFIEKVGALVIGANKSNNLNESANRITLLRDANHDGIAEVRTTFLDGLYQPFGM